MEEDRERRGEAAAVVVGYGLEGKKVESFLKASLVSHAGEVGIRFLALDPDASLEQQYQQATFHCVVHKLYGVDWERHLLDFRSKHPLVPIVDCPSAIRRLHNRVSMLDAVTRIPDFDGKCSFGIPRQVLLHPFGDVEEEIEFPVVVKPLEADGRSACHEMSLVFNRKGLEKVSPPAVLQEFVNHGGVVFKVYVAGEQVRCVKRKSLPDVTTLNLESDQPIIAFSRISNMADKDEDEVEVEMPPSDLVAHLAAGLRRELELRLFNFDMIQDKSNKYLIIDINYFPGYAKLPGFETMFTQFLLDVVNTATSATPLL